MYAVKAGNAALPKPTLFPCQRSGNTFSFAIFPDTVPSVMRLTIHPSTCGEMGLSEKSFSDSPISPQVLGWMVNRITDGTVSGKIAKEKVFPDLWQGNNVGLGRAALPALTAYIEGQGLKQISDPNELEKLVDEAIAAGAKQVADYRAGKEKALQSLVGQVMKASKGKANPAQVNELLRKKLTS